MQIGHQLRLFAVQTDQLVCHLKRMTGRVAQARQPLDSGKPPQQACETPLAAIGTSAMIGVYVLTEQSELTHALRDKVFGFLGDGNNTAREFRAARIGHDAKRAELVAAFLNGKVRRDAFRVARFRQFIEFFFGREICGEALAVFARSAGDQLWQAMIGLRADHQIYGGRAAQDFRAFGLRHAAGDDDLHGAASGRALFFDFAQTAEFGEHLLRRLLADVARVEDHHVGVVAVFRLRIAERREQFGHALAVIDIHLTAIGLDVKRAARRAVCGRVGHQPQDFLRADASSIGVP